MSTTVGESWEVRLTVVMVATGWRHTMVDILAAAWPAAAALPASIVSLTNGLMTRASVDHENLSCDTAAVCS